MSQFEIKAIDLLRQAGFYPPTLLFDGKIHRFKRQTNDQRLNAWYVGFLHDDFVVIVFSDWKNPQDAGKILITQSDQITQEQFLKARAHIKEVQKQQDQELLIRQETVSVQSDFKFSKAKNFGAHDYLKKKGLKKLYGSRINGAQLFVPLYDLSGRLWSLQTITQEGTKRFPKSGKKKGLFFPIGEKKTSPILFCEGFATGASLFEATGLYTVVCFDGGNLKPVIESFRKHLGQHYPFFICGDNDASQAGLHYAQKAAKEDPSIRIILPESLGDFNDLYLNKGGEAVKATILGANQNHFLSTEKWIEQWIENKKIKVFHNGSLQMESKACSFEDILHHVFVDQKLDGAKIAKGFLESYLHVYFKEAQQKAFEAFIQPFFEAPNDPLKTEVELKEWLKALLGSFSDQDLAVIKHFFWQVKRKLKGLSVENHMMPIFWGKTGSGKSKAIEHLLKPLENLAAPSSMDVFADSRRWEVFERHAVMFMDEMVRAQWADFNAMKHVLSQNYLTFQAKYARKTAHVFNLATFIGTSNLSPDQIILDTTSNRRFYFFHCLEKGDWETINRIDYQEIWRLVDPLEPCPVIDRIQDIKVNQEQTRNRDPIEEFIEDLQIQCSLKSGHQSVVSTQKISELYLQWLEQNYYEKKRFDPGTVSKMLRQLGFTKSDRMWLKSIDGPGEDQNRVVHGPRLKIRGFYLFSEQFQQLECMHWKPKE